MCVCSSTQAHHYLAVQDPYSENGEADNGLDLPVFVSIIKTTPQTCSLAILV